MAHRAETLGATEQHPLVNQANESPTMFWSVDIREFEGNLTEEERENEKENEKVLSCFSCFYVMNICAFILS